MSAMSSDTTSSASSPSPAPALGNPAAPAVSPRVHPALAKLFSKAEARHFTDEELHEIVKVYPDRAPQAATVRSVRHKDLAIINALVKEIFSEYGYEHAHELAYSKCTRDIRYVVIYATHAMLAHDPKWLDDRLLLWLRGILQSFSFPDRKKQDAGKALFADPVLETRLRELPRQCRSIFHTYYRLQQEMQKKLDPPHYFHIAPYLSQATFVLSEPA
ncbi:hypothetical protein DB346_04625 [Verrucomicrobia bacterium LW23]|nr:hypothetical protein DB346_04625 [Verrucomicrobia bacterium LW23]